MKKPRIKENYRYVFTNDREVAAGARFAGNWVWGYAHCHPDDLYDENFGKTLAAARCNAKIANLRWKRATERYRKARIALAQAEKEFNEACDYFTRAYDLRKEARYRVYALDIERPPYAD